MSNYRELTSNHLNLYIAWHAGQFNKSSCRWFIVSNETAGFPAATRARTASLAHVAAGSPGSCGWRWPRPVWGAAAGDSGGSHHRIWTPSARASAPQWRRTGNAHVGVLGWESKQQGVCKLEKLKKKSIRPAKVKGWEALYMAYGDLIKTHQ